VWDVAPNGGVNARPGSWGGHCVFVPKYDAQGFTCITWGQPKTMTLAFWKKYCDEAHTLLGQDWLTAKGSPRRLRPGPVAGRSEGHPVAHPAPNSSARV
jgi:hypothetical protein